MVEPHNYMRNIQKVETMKTQMSTVFMGVMGFLEFGKKCSKIVEKVVAAGYQIIFHSREEGQELLLFVTALVGGCCARIR